MSTRRSFEYKWDYLAGIVTSLVYNLTRLAFVWLLFEAGGVSEILGFNVYQFYLVLGVTQFVVSVSFLVCGPSSGTFRRDVHSGQLDAMLVKPVNVIFYQSWRVISVFNAIGAMAYSVGLFIWAYYKLGLTWDVWLVGKFILILMVSVILSSIFHWISALLWIYWPKFDILRRLLNNTTDFSRYPMQAYPRTLNWILIFILPVMLMGNQVYDLMQGRYGLELIGRDLGVVAVFGFIWFYMWKDGMKRYNSAN